MHYFKVVPIYITRQPCQEITNNVGGYVTLQVIDHGTRGMANNLSLYYMRDVNTLLDKITFPFARTVFENTQIMYIDNLSMLVRNYCSGYNDNIRDHLFAIINKQANFISSQEIIETQKLNSLIEFINNKQEMEISHIDVPARADISIIELGNLIIEGTENEKKKKIDLEYLKSFS